MDRRAKIIATLGPSSDDENILRKLIIAGLDIVRLNFSHLSLSLMRKSRFFERKN